MSLVAIVLAFVSSTIIFITSLLQINVRVYVTFTTLSIKQLDLIINDVVSAKYT